MKQIGWKLRKALKWQTFITKDKAREYNYIFDSPDVQKIINGTLSVLSVKENKEVK